MGGGNPIKSVTKAVSNVVSDVAGNRIVKAVSTGGASEVVRKFETSDTLKAMTGRQTSAEKEALNQQKASLLAEKMTADQALALRKARMDKKQQGRGSLLSGTELGLTSTLG